MLSESPPKTQQREPRRPRVVAVIGGRSGVGKTSIAVNVGIVLAKNAARVCIVDGSSGDCDASYLLGLVPEVTLDQVLFGSKSLEDALLYGPYGMKVLPGAQLLNQGKSLQRTQHLRVKQELERLEYNVDWFLLDTPRRVSGACLDFISVANPILVVLTPDPTSLSEAFAQVKFLRQLRGIGGFQVVVNMCANGEQAKEIFHRFSSAVEKYIGIKVLFFGYLLRDESVRLGFSMQSPVALLPETDPSTRGFLRLAEGLHRFSSAKQPGGISHYWCAQFAGADSPSFKEIVGHPKMSGSADALSDLKARWLSVMESCEEEQTLLIFLEELLGLFAERFGSSALGLGRQHPAMLTRTSGTAAQVQNSVEMAEEDKTLNVAPIPETIHCSQPTAKRQEGLEDSFGHPHGYVRTKFGSQRALLDKLRNSAAADLSTLELFGLR